MAQVSVRKAEGEGEHGSLASGQGHGPSTSDAKDPMSTPTTLHRRALVVRRDDASAIRRLPLNAELRDGAKAGVVVDP